MPIISPWLFYLADVSDAIKCIAFTGSIIMFAVLVALAFTSYIEGSNEIAKKVRLYTIIGGVMIFIGLLFPTEETCYKMMAASLATPENIQTMGQSATNIVDYIVDSIDQLLEKEEKEESK